MGIRLMIADDHAAVRSGVISLIQGTEIEMICHAETCEQTVSYALTCQPDVLLLDIRLADSDGLSALEQISSKNPRIAVLMFSASAEVKTMALARKLGAKGYVSKAVSREELLKCIRRVTQGKNVWSPHQLRQITCRATKLAVAANDRNPLSARESSVLRKIVEGLPNEAIAEELGINVETVKQHVKHLLRKLHVEDRAQAAVIAVRSDLSLVSKDIR